MDDGMLLEEMSFFSSEDNASLIYVSRGNEILCILSEDASEQEVELRLDELVDCITELDVSEMEDRNAHCLILDAMAAHLNSCSIQRNGCYILAKLMELSNKFSTELEMQQLHKYIVKVIISIFPKDLCIQVWGLKILAILAKSSYIRRQLTNDSCMIDSILLSMKMFSDEDLQTAAFLMLAQLFRDQITRDRFVNNHNHHLIINAMEQHYNSAEVQEHGCWVLKWLSASDVNIRVFMQEEVYIHALVAMETFQFNSSVQAAGCSLLEALAHDSVSRIVLVERDVTESILRSIANHIHDKQVLMWALGALEFLTESVIDTFSPEQCESSHWLQDIFTAMATHGDDPTVQEFSCRCLSKLVECCEYVCDYIGDRDDQIPVHSLVMAAFMVHQGDVYVFRAACAAIYNIAENSGELQEAFWSKGIYLHILKALTKQDDVSEVQEWGLRALRALCQDRSDYKDTLVYLHLLDYTTSALDNFPNDSGVQEEAIGTLACLAFDLKVVRHQCIVEQVHLKVLNAVQHHQQSVLLVEMALELLGVLSAVQGVPEMLLNAKALEIIINSMKKNPSQSVIQQKSCIILQILSNDLRWDDSLYRSAAEVISEAMAKFETDPKVQAEACVTLQLMAETGPDISKILVEQSVHELLFVMLEHFPDDQLLIDLASECLFILGCLYDLKSQMLKSACANGMVRAAECLIELGADVNAGDGTDTPLCLACFTNNYEMVSFLLTQGVTDVQNALRLCLDILHYDDLVGLLLKHMGHDKEGGMILWSGLQLGGLKAKWLAPALCNRRFLARSPQLSRWAGMIRNAEDKRRRRSSISLMDDTLLKERSFSEVEYNDSVFSEMNFRTPSASIHSDINVVDDHRKSLTSPDVSYYDRSGQSLRFEDEFSPPRVDLGCDFEENTTPTRSMSDVKIDHKALFTIGDNSFDELRKRSSSGPSNRSSRRRSSFTLTSSVANVSSIHLRPISISGAALPFSPQDPRIVSISNKTQIILPRSETRPRTFSSDFENRPLSRLSDTEHSVYADEVSTLLSEDEFDEETVEKLPRPKSVSDAESMVMGKPCLTRRTNSESRLRKGTRAKNVQSAYEDSVRLIDVSGNGITELSSVVKRGRSILSSLSNIEKLDLSQNKLNALPQELFSAMPKLQQLFLKDNYFTVFPRCVMGNPQLQVVDLSNNQIIDMEETDQTSVFLESLNLSNNQISSFPNWLKDRFPTLTTLSLAGNFIKELPHASLGLRRLKSLDISSNMLKIIPSVFLSECYMLNTLIASDNEFVTLPEDVSATLTNLSTLKLSRNCLSEKAPFYIPRFILQSPALQCVDLSYNKITQIPSPLSWTSQNLKELILDHNKISKVILQDRGQVYANLQRLVLNHNKLKKVPPGVGELSSLTSLDISYNSAISTLPIEMGRLSKKLWEFPLAGLRLDVDPSVRKKTKDLIGYLHCKLKNCVPYFQMKIAVLGPPGRGKSTLVQYLTQVKTKSRDKVLILDMPQVEITDWKVKDNKASCKSCNGKSLDYVFNMWDFSGQAEGFIAHQCFLTPRALYLVVYDASRGVSELEKLRRWLMSIQARSPQSLVMLVGTHLDRVPPVHTRNVLAAFKDGISKLHNSPGFPAITGHGIVSCAHDKKGNGVAALRDKILEVIRSCKCQGETVIGQQVPSSYIRIKELMVKHDLVLKENYPVLTRGQLKKLLLDAQLQLDDEDDLDQAANFLHEKGVVLHFDDSVNRLSDLYFIDPLWLYRLIVKVISLPISIQDGVVHRDNIKNILTSDIFPPEMVPAFLRLMEKFEIILPLNSEDLLFPSKLPEKPPVISLPNTSSSLIRRLYDMPYIPTTFWPRVVAHFMVFAKTFLSNEAKMHCDIRCWQEGMYSHWSEQAYFFLAPLATNSHVIEVFVPATKHGCVLLGHVVDHLDALLEEWFPSLCGVDELFGQRVVKKQIPCALCPDGKEYVFSLEQCVEAIEQCDFISCPNHPADPVPLQRIAPDVVLADLNQSQLIKEGSLELKQTKDNLLGDGAYGAVYRGRYKAQAVAVKVFSLDSGTDPFCQLRQELAFLRHLRHPSIITMIGACVRPQALVLELANKKSLNDILKSGKPPSRGIQHRIAMQVAEGLTYLHHNRIVYRDLKPHNILIFSLNLGDLINAKISDYGIARYASSYGLVSSQGTPGYRAPEVARFGDIPYNKEADVYSFGIMLYELVTGGRKPFGDLRFPSELDVATVSGQVIDPITCSGSPPWPDVQDLIDHCLEAQPDKRPTAEQVFDRLCSEELLCLKRSIAVCKDQTVECMTVRNYTQDGASKVEVWMGSGMTGNYSSQLSWIDLTNSTSEGCQGMFLKDSRIKSMVSVRAQGNDLIVAGTQSGNLWVFDAQTHTCLHSLPPLSDAVLCLRHYHSRTRSLVLGGLASGELVVYEVKELLNPKAEPITIELFGKSKDKVKPLDKPIACMAFGKKRVFCGCGNNVVVLKLDTLQIERRWAVQDRHLSLVLNIVVDNEAWTSTRHSTIIDIWDLSKTHLKASIDCREFVRSHYPETPELESRVISMLLHPRVALWVGTGGGHMICLDPSTYAPIKVLRRHTSALRCLETGFCMTSQRTLLLSGGMGFLERKSAPQNSRSDFGYVLVWESDFKEQKKYLETDKKRRKEWLTHHGKMTGETTLLGSVGRERPASLSPSILLQHKSF